MPKRIRMIEFLHATLALEIAKDVDNAASKLVEALMMKIRSTPGWITLETNASELQCALQTIQATRSRLL